MRITYDPEADAMYIEFRAGQVYECKEVAEDIILDLDRRGRVVGIEILGAKTRTGSNRPLKLTFENLVSKETNVLPTGKFPKTRHRTARMTTK